MPRAAATVPYDRRFVGWLSLAQLISWGSTFYTFALIMGPAEQALGISRVQSSLGLSLAFLVEGLVAFAVGRWIDQGYERVVMTVGSLLAALCFGLHVWVNSLIGFYLLWMGLGAAMACVLYVPAFSVVTRRFPADFRRAIITLTFLGGLASTVFIPLVAYLIAQWGWRSALVGLGLMHLLLCAPLHAYLLRHAVVKPQALGTQSTRSQGELAALLKSPGFLLVATFVILSTPVTAGLPAHLINLLRENQLPEAWVIAIPASIGVIQLLGRLLLFFFEHHINVHMVNRFIPMLMPLALLALLAADLLGASHVGLVLVFVLLYGMGNGMLTIVKGTAMAEYVNRQHVAGLNGAVGLPLALVRAGAPLALGALWSAQTGYRLGLGLLLMCALGSLGAIITAQKRSGVALQR